MSTLRYVLKWGRMEGGRVREGRERGGEGEGGERRREGREGRKEREEGREGGEEGERGREGRKGGEGKKDGEENRTFLPCIIATSYKCTSPLPRQLIPFSLFSPPSPQLSYTGMLETVRIRREGYPFRPPFDEFVERLVSLT